MVKPVPLAYITLFEAGLGEALKRLSIRGGNLMRAIMGCLGRTNCAIAAVCCITLTAANATAKPDAVGGGYGGNGLVGEYFANAELSGQPAFSRRDVRIDHDWGELGLVGGSNWAAMKTFPRDNFSIRWTGTIIPRFTEAYTFVAHADDGIRVRIRPAGSQTWTTLIDEWSTAGSFASPVQSLTAGETYELQVEYHDLSGPALCRLQWMSHNTPLEVIDPVVHQALNATSWYGYEDHVWANRTKTARWDNGRSVLDSLGWPADTATMVMSESNASERVLAGMYLVTFTGKAAITTGCCNAVTFRVGTQTWSNQLPRGEGYDAATNTTTAEMWVDGSRLVDLRFREAARDGSDNTGTGVTDIKLMRPIAPDDSTYHDTSEIVHRQFKTLVAPHYTCLRWLQGANARSASTWEGRTRPGYAFFSKSLPGQNWSDQENWEYLIMLANETGKDLYLTLPVDADDEYLSNMAKLLKYGSDGYLPYESMQQDPLYPPLNCNLRAYFEIGNEIWNWAFASTQQAQQALKAESLANSPVWQQVNYDGNAGPAVWSGALRRWQIIRTVALSNAFRGVWGDQAIGARIRALIEYQYNNEQGTAYSSFTYYNNWYNNGDGDHVAQPRPITYYIWGGGGATYYGVGNPYGNQSSIVFADSSFETPQIGDNTLQMRPGGSPWTFTGDAGIYRSTQQNASIGVLSAADAAPDGNQAAFLIDTGSISQTINFTHAGEFAVTFHAAGEGGGWPGYQHFDVLVDGQSVNPQGQTDIRLSDGGFGIGGWSRATDNLDEEWGSAVFTIDAPGNHTVTFKGRSVTGDVLMIDNVRISSVDSLLESGFGSGQAWGQVAGDDYTAQLNSQAKYTRTFGLETVAYEAGWSVGGDFHQRPIQNWCKLVDDRAMRINDTAQAIWDRSGSAMQVWGVYTYHPSYDFDSASTYPIMRSIRAISNKLRDEPTNGKAVPGVLRAIHETDDVSWSYGGDRNQLRGRGHWASWLFTTAERAEYEFTVYARGSGAFKVDVDSDPIGALSSTSGSAHTAFTVDLTRGAHAVRVECTRDSVTVDSIVVTSSPVSVAPRELAMPTAPSIHATVCSTHAWQMSDAPPVAFVNASAGATSHDALSSPRRLDVVDNEVDADAEAQVTAPLYIGGLPAQSPVEGEPAKLQAVRGDNLRTPPPPSTEEVFVPHDMRWYGPDGSLGARAVRASSQREPHAAAAVVDRDLRTRWSPESSGRQWIELDLGQAGTVGTVTFVWYARKRMNRQYRVEVSTDGVSYERAATAHLRGRGTETTTVTFTPRSARYVRLCFDESPLLNIYEAAVQAGPPCAEAAAR
ncbi:MAG: hypothetical protein GF331_16895 [Chitinivibrionales bacterium]|nr:hypothetical protein [Chitinivibrionales bacterium]